MKTKGRILIEYMAISSGKQAKCATQLSKKRHVIVCLIPTRSIVKSKIQSFTAHAGEKLGKHLKTASKIQLRIKLENYGLCINTGKPNWGKVNSEKYLDLTIL